MEEKTESAMEAYLRKRNMTIIEFAHKARCSRQTIWKLKHGIAVSPEIAYRVFVASRGEILAKCSPVGRQPKEKK